MNWTRSRRPLIAWKLGLGSAMSKEILGHINCPTCGAAEKMRITPDKNGAPFGFCLACRQQLRVGGDETRVFDFYKAHPGIKKPGAAPVTVTAAEPAPAEKPAAAPVPVTPAAPAPARAPAAPAKKARAPVANPFDFLLNGAKA